MQGILPLSRSKKLRLYFQSPLFFQLNKVTYSQITGIEAPTCWGRVTFSLFIILNVQFWHWILPFMIWILLMFGSGIEFCLLWYAYCLFSLIFVRIYFVNHFPSLPLQHICVTFLKWFFFWTEHFLKYFLTLFSGT